MGYAHAVQDDGKVLLCAFFTTMCPHLAPMRHFHFSFAWNCGMRAAFSTAKRRFAMIMLTREYVR
jgi:hypothetical protein